MSRQTIQEKSQIIRQETQQYANTRGRVADVIDDINETKADQEDLVQLDADVYQALQQEATTRAQADQANATAIQQEATTRAQADQANATAIQQEATTRAQADNNLQQQITAEAAARSQADALKLDKPLAPYNTDGYVVMGDGSTKPAGDLGKNIYNTDGVLTANRYMDLAAYYLYFSNSTNTAKIGINKSAPTEALDVAGRVRMDSAILNPNTTGALPNRLRSDGTYVYFSSSSSVERRLMYADYADFKLLTQGMSEAQRTEWKTLMNGGWTTNTMSVAIITPPIVDIQDKNYWLTLKGANLNLPPTSFSLEIMDSTGTNVLATVPNSQVQTYSNGLDLTFYYNFKNLPIGNYRIRLWNGVAYYTTGASVVIRVVNLVNSVDIGTMTWTRKIYNNATSPAISESGSSVLYRADPNIRPLGADGIYIAARKSSEMIAANENFSMTVVFNGLAGEIRNASGSDMFFMGLVPSATNVDLLNQTITNIRFRNSYWYPMVEAYADLGGSINFNSSGSYTGRAIFTRNNGLWTILLEMNNTVVVHTKTGSMEALSFGMYNQNTQTVTELNATITELYKF